MRHRYPLSILTLVAGLALSTIAPPVHAQRAVPVTVENEETQPVPVYTAGRRPYQFHYALNGPAGSPEDCSEIPVPAGMLLTIQSVGVDATIHDSSTPDVYLRVSRTTAFSQSLDRYRGTMEYQSTYGNFQSYTGIYNLTLFAGTTDGGVSYAVAICVNSPFSGAGGSNSARGIVTGYVESLTILDGASLP